MPPRIDPPNVKIARIGAWQAVFVAALTTVGGFATGYVTKPHGEKLGTEAATKHAATVDKTLDEAKKRSRPYAIQALTMMVQFEATPSSDDPLRADVRTSYTVLPLQTTPADQNTTFTEQYGSSYARWVQYWPGSEREILRGRPGEGKVYDILFDAKQGESHTVITGATFHYDSPLADGRSAFSSRLRLPPREEFWSYPNREDVIREITMIVTSHTLRIHPVGQAAKRSRADRTTQETDARFQTDDSLPTGYRTISYRWLDILPGEEVGIHFAWDATQ